MNKTPTARQACEAFACAVQAKRHTLAPGREEDRLRHPTEDLLVAMGQLHGLDVQAIDESPLDDIGRPDFAVTVNRLLCGYLELKAPGTGADPNRFKGHNRRQWERFQFRFCPTSSTPTAPRRARGAAAAGALSPVMDGP